jgi:hypothetical protein
MLYSGRVEREAVALPHALERTGVAVIELREAAGDSLVDMRLGYDADPVVAREQGLLHGFSLSEERITCNVTLQVTGVAIGQMDDARAVTMADRNTEDAWQRIGSP